MKRGDNIEKYKIKFKSYNFILQICLDCGKLFVSEDHEKVCGGRNYAKENMSLKEQIEKIIEDRCYVESCANGDSYAGHKIKMSTQGMKELLGLFQGMKDLLGLLIKKDLELKKEALQGFVEYLEKTNVISETDGTLLREWKKQFNYKQEMEKYLSSNEKNSSKLKDKNNE